MIRKIKELPKNTRVAIIGFALVFVIAIILGVSYMVTLDDGDDDFIEEPPAKTIDEIHEEYIESQEAKPKLDEDTYEREYNTMIYYLSQREYDAAAEVANNVMLSHNLIDNEKAAVFSGVSQIYGFSDESPAADQQILIDGISDIPAYTHLFLGSSIANQYNMIMHKDSTVIQHTDQMLPIITGIDEAEATECGAIGYLDSLADYNLYKVSITQGSFDFYFYLADHAIYGGIVPLRIVPVQDVNLMNYDEYMDFYEIEKEEPYM